MKDPENSNSPVTETDIEARPRFRELPPQEFWAGSISLEDIDFEKFEQAIKQSCEETNQNFTGYLSKDPLTNKYTNYTRTRYPRKKYGEFSTLECQEGIGQLAAHLGVNYTEVEKTEEPKFVIVLGLLEGYDKQNKLHTIDEVRKILGDNFLLTPGEVYSAGNLYSDQYAVYREPAVIIEGNKNNIQQVYNLAHHFKQNRFCVEDLQDRTSHTVETGYCIAPDP